MKRYNLILGSKFIDIFFNLSQLLCGVELHLEKGDMRGQYLCVPFFTIVIKLWRRE
jgi:hypothetical protein